MPIPPKLWYIDIWYMIYDMSRCLEYGVYDVYDEVFRARGVVGLGNTYIYRVHTLLHRVYTKKKQSIPYMHVCQQYM